MKKTKIVATMGDNTNELNIIKEMIDKGVNVFRIVLGNIDLDKASNYINNIRLASKNMKQIVGIMLDLDGPSIRLNKLVEDKIFIPMGSKIKIYNHYVLCNEKELSTNYDNLIDLVNLNDIIGIGYGDVKLKVIDITDDYFVTEVIDEGYIKSNQTLHLEKDNFKLPFINPHDKENILFAIKENIDFLSLSYVRDEQDVLSVVDLLIENENDHIEVLSKIETEEAFENIDEILKVSDGVIVARGDLGINTNVEKLPFYQKEILKKANINKKIGLISTDLLKSMIDDKTPSRGEILDIYNSVLDKADALILSDETTVGSYPIQTIEVLAKVLEEAEDHFDYKENLETTFKEEELDITSTISYSVVNSSLLLNTNCILANTLSGYTARKISYYRPKSIILGLTPNKDTALSLTLNYGIIPVVVKKFKQIDEILDECINKYKEIIEYQENDIVIITGGFPSNSKSTNFMKIQKIN